MEKIDGGVIHSLAIGADWKNAFTLTVGKVVNGLTISTIVRDENNFYFFGNVRYVVYVKNKDGVECIWRTYENMPAAVTYEI